MLKILLIVLILIFIYKLISIEGDDDDIEGIEYIYNNKCKLKGFKEELEKKNITYELNNSLLKWNFVQSTLYNILPSNLKKNIFNIYRSQVIEEEFKFEDDGITDIEYLLTNKKQPYLYFINTISMDAFYVKKLMLELNTKYNYNCVFIYSRGFKTIINNNITYLSNITDDLEEVLNYLFIKLNSECNILVGVSMGSNSFCKYLCTNNKNKDKISGFISISNPLDLLGLCYAETSSLINNYMIHRYFKKSIRNYLESNFKNNNKIYKNIGYYIKNMDEFYLKIIKPYAKNKYKNFDDYCFNISCINFIEELKTPSLFIYAKDDYATPVSKLNKTKLKKNNNIFQLYTKYGSHTGYYKDNGEIWLIEAIDLFVKYLN